MGSYVVGAEEGISVGKLDGEVGELEGWALGLLGSAVGIDDGCEEGKPLG